MRELDTVSLVRFLASGGFVDDVTQREAFKLLKGANKETADYLREDVEIGLGYCGMVLKSNSTLYPDYFYAVPEVGRLDTKGDLGSLRKKLNSIIANATGYLGFIELIDKATGKDALPNAGHIFDLGEMQSALANSANTSLQNLFEQVINTRYFKPALKNRLKNNRERLEAMILKLLSDDLIADDGTGINYAFTGKFAYEVTVVEQVRNSISPIEDTPTASQQELV